MTTPRHAEREAQAIAAAERIKAVVGDGAWYGTAMCQRETNPAPLDMRNDACKIMHEILAATEQAALEELREAAIPFLRFRTWANRGCTVNMVEKVLLDIFGPIEPARSDDDAYKEFQDTFTRQRELLWPSKK